MISRAFHIIIKLTVFFSLLTGPYLVYAFTPPVDLSIDLPPKTHEYYVNLDAGSNGNGTQSSPWNSIEAADGNVAIPAWIYVKGTGPGAVWSQSGSSGSEIVITAWGSETVIFTDISGGPSFRIWGEYVILDGKSFSSPQLVIVGAAGQRTVRIGYDHGACGPHATIYRCEIKQGSTAIMNHGEYLRVVNCKIHDTTSHAIYFLHGDHCEFRNNIFWNTQGAAIQSNPHSSGEHIIAGVISGNVIYDCAIGTAAGLTVLSGTGAGGVLEGITIYNNLLWDCPSGGIKMTGSDNYTGTITDVYIYNNTLYNCALENQHGPPYTSDKPATTTCRNNIVTGGFNNQGTWVAEDHNLTSNPGFLSTDENNEYFLKLSSASTVAIDKGSDLSSEGIADDYFGNSRPQKSGYDIGAHEYEVKIPTNLKITSVTHSPFNVTLEWNGDPDFDHYVLYWGTSSGNYTTGNSGDIVDTFFTVTGLTEGTIYYLAVKGYFTPTGETEYSNEVDTKAPQITSPPTVTSITDTTATIVWNTDEPGTSVVNYKKAEDALYTEKELTYYVTNHSVTLTGLDPNNSYVFFVNSTDAGGAGPDISDTDNNPSDDSNPADVYTFQTGVSSDTTPPQITSPPTVTSITNITAVIEWQTDEPSTSLVQYDDNSSTWGNYLWSKTDTSLVTTHSVTLTGLTADTTYYFRVGSTDGFYNGPTTSNEVNFTTETTPDTTYPIITTPPTVTGITKTTAVIYWQTDEPSNSLVDYGLTTSYGSQATLAAYVTNHSVTLTGLTAGTNYHFRVGSTDAAGNGPTYSNDCTFKTENVDDQAPQITTPPTVTNITDSTAVITWQTDEPSNSMVQYDTTSRSAWADYLSSENDAGMVTSHSVTVTGLTAGGTYYFMVGSADAFGNGPDTSTTDNNPSVQQYFTTELTPDTDAPVISSVIVPGTSNTTAIITWTTDEPSNSMVHYGTSSSTWGNYLWSENDAGMVTTHTVTLTGLTVGSTYYFRVGSNDASGNGPDLNSNSTNPSAQQSFITDLTPDTEAPVISSVAVAGTTDTIAIITWTTDEPSNSMVHYGATFQNWGSYDSVESDAEMVTSHSATLTGLTQGNTYHFRVGSTDALGNGPTLNFNATNPSTDDTVTTTEPDTSAPVISNMIVAGTTDNIAIITWTTDELSNTMVRYDTASRSTWAGYQWSKNDAQMVTSHSVTLTGLTKGTTYHFRVGSNDVFGNGPDLNAGPSNPYPKPPVNDSIFTTTSTDTDPPSITGYSIDYVNDTIDITYDEANVQNANIEANYSFSPTLYFRTSGGSDDITYIGSNTYRLFMSIVPENTAFTLTVSGITDEAGNEVDPNSITIDTPPAAGGVKEVLPHHNAGIDDSIRVPNNTSFAARIEDSDGINTTDLESIKFIIDDGVNLPYEYNLGNTTVVRVVQLDSTESADNVTKLWAVYDRSMDYTYGNVYSFGATATISVDAKDKNQKWMDQGVYSFKVETQQQHDDAEADLPTTVVVDPSDPDLEGSYVYDTGAQLSSGQLAGAKILYDSNEPVTPKFGPTGEIPGLNISGVDAVGVPMNLQPPTVFNTPVEIFIPCPGYTYASTLSVYRYTGTSWVLACNASGTVQAGGEGWMVPGSRVNHNLGNPSTIGIQVFHFTGVQAGSPSGSGGRTTDAVSGGGCFIATAAYGSNMDRHVKILTEFRDRRLVTNSIGRCILNAYYTFSPPVASYLHKHPFARAVVRYALIPITGVAYISLYIHPLVLLFAFIFMLLTGIYFFKRSAIRSQRSAM